MTNEELEKEIEKKKNNLESYQKLAKRFNFPDEEAQIQINQMLDDLAKLLKERKAKE